MLLSPTLQIQPCIVPISESCLGSTGGRICCHDMHSILQSIQLLEHKVSAFCNSVEGCNVMLSWISRNIQPGGCFVTTNTTVDLNNTHTAQCVLLTVLGVGNWHNLWIQVIGIVDQMNDAHSCLIQFPKGDRIAGCPESNAIHSAVATPLRKPNQKYL
jgi:hypothetical protein